MREIAASMDLDEDKILNDQREASIQAEMMAAVAAMMPQQPQQHQGPLHAVCRRRIVQQYRRLQSQRLHVCHHRGLQFVTGCPGVRIRWS